ncbi:hypothetical protein QVD17_00838 [Tagetes erecta]|uniref:Fatty acyl-CoA reductase n=1 Tax=Tagetes erecta TaxID=13708 RepID=A0AAD8P683_TARER|nr:hypothetical protein QVD17_00838 [Tagetes erecta]
MHLTLIILQLLFFRTRNITHWHNFQSIIMELGSIVDFLENKVMLITGATGFLAKIFVEKILRVQPNVKKLYLLVRAADGKSALKRFNTEAVAKDLFKLLKEKHGTNLQPFLAEKVTLVAGDITCEDLGVQDSSLKAEMWRDVDVVVNAAATTNFDERYDVALNLNTFGAKNVLNFAQKCVNIKLLLHISTAYVFGEKPGLILETPYYLGESLNGRNGLDIDEEKKILEYKLKELKSHNASDELINLAMKDLGMQRANHYGWPNTYVFTKALGEMIIGHLKGDMPVVIIRPTIVTSTFKEPFPGWVEGIRTIDSLALGYAKGRLTCFLGNPEGIYDVVPADMVVNAMIAAMVANANLTCSEAIYHVGSSVSNPLKFATFQKCAFRYFTDYPWIGKDGKHVMVGEVTVLNSMSSFYRYVGLRYLLPLLILRFINFILCRAFDDTYKNLNRKINFVLRLVDLYKPYLFTKCFYDDMNTEKLRRVLRVSGNEESIFYFDPRIINWDNYFEGIHLPGLRQREFK